MSIEGPGNNKPRYVYSRTQLYEIYKRQTDLSLPPGKTIPEECRNSDSKQSTQRPHQTRTRL